MSDDVKVAVPVRDSRGLFVRGNPGGPGPTGFGLKVRTFRHALLDAVTTDDIQSIARGLVRDAKAGDVLAARLVLAYALGEPTEVSKAAGNEEREQALIEASRVG